MAQIDRTTTFPAADAARLCLRCFFGGALRRRDSSTPLQQITARAARVGFDWPELAGARLKIDEELRELALATESGDRARTEAELGDLLLAVVNVARKLECDAEGALRTATRRFEQRFEYIEDRLFEAHVEPREAGLERLDALWNEAKDRTG